LTKRQSKGAMVTPWRQPGPVAANAP